eukprot:366319-Chlamydomonas_euryale.AAC.1
MAGERSGSDSAVDSDSTPAGGVWLVGRGVAASGTAPPAPVPQAPASPAPEPVPATALPLVSPPWGGGVSQSGGVGYCLGKCCC